MMVSRLRDIAEYARAVSTNESLSWEERYGLVFSSHCSLRVFAMDPSFAWYDPDCGYEEDVRAFVRALERRYLS